MEANVSMLVCIQYFFWPSSFCSSGTWSLQWFVKYKDIYRLVKSWLATPSWRTLYKQIEKFNDSLTFHSLKYDFESWYNTTLTYCLFVVMSKLEKVRMYNMYHGPSFMSDFIIHIIMTSLVILICHLPKVRTEK